MGAKSVKICAPQTYFEQSKVLLVWVKLQTTPCSLLPFSVLREICTYLDSRQPLLAARPRAVYAFNEHTFDLLWRLSTELPLSDLSAFVHFGSDKMMVFGGLDKDFVASSSAFLVEAGAVTQLPEMTYPRAAPGALYDHIHSRVYVFGGLSRAKTLRSAEYFLSSQWMSLPEMQVSRAYFNPCFHRALIYLCGGRSTTIETYDPSTQQYALVAEMVLPAAADISDCTSVISDNNLVVISSDFVITFELQAKSMRRQFTAGRFHVWSNCPPVLFRGVVYFSGYCSNLKPVCRALDLTKTSWLDEVVFLGEM